MQPNNTFFLYMKHEIIHNIFNYNFKHVFC